MRVVYLLNIFPKISEAFILNEMLALRKKGVEIEIFAYEPSGEETVHPAVREFKPVTYLNARRSAWDAVWPHFYWLLRRPLGYLKTVFLVLTHGSQIRKLFMLRLKYAVEVMRAAPDHVHAHFGDYAANYAMVFSRLSGIPYTFTTHGHDIFNFPPPNFPVKTRLAKRHITISEHNRKYLVGHFGLDERQITVVHCGVDFDAVPSLPRLPEPGLMVCIARLSPEKGLDVLFRACAKLKQKGVHFRCRILGEGPERVSLERLIQELGLGAEVTLEGNCTHAQVLQWLSKAGVKVLASRFEGIPVSLMEAMALGVPVVATRITGIPELIEDGQSGFLVPAENVDALAEKIEAVLSDAALRERFVQNGRRKVREEFNLKTETDKLLRIWSEPGN